MILIQTLWRCARTLITTTTLSLLFHYSLSLLLCSTLQGRRKQGAGGGKLPLPLQLLSDMLTLFQSGSRLCPPVIALISTYPGFSDLLTALQCTVVKLTSLVIIVACWQETILLMMSTTPASLYALVINALLFIGFYTKMRCPQIALTFSGDSSFEVQLLFIKTSQGCSECDLVCQFVICRFILYPERLYNIYISWFRIF